MALLDTITQLLQKATGTIVNAIVPPTVPVAPGDTKIPGPGTFGGLTVTIAPFSNKADPAGVTNTSSTAGIPGGVAGEFTSQLSHGQSKTITVTFSKDVSQVAITIRNSHTNQNRMVAYDANGKLLGTVTFAYNPNANDYNNNFFDRKSLSLAGIRRIDLVPGTGEYVTYKDLVVTSQLAAVVTPAQPPSAPGDRVVSIPLQIRAIKAPAPAAVSVQLTVDAMPQVPHFAPTPFATGVTLQVRPIPIPLEAVIEQLARELTTDRINSFFDNDRVLKTVLNFGDDFQTLLTNWMKDPNNLTDDQILVKLYKPLPLNIEVKDLLWISRELSPTLLDQISVIITPDKQIVLFLRPPNRAINAGGLFGVEVNNITMGQLLPSGSLVSTDTSVTLKDPLLEEFFTTDLAGVDLNVDYTDYNNFVHFGSAAARLQVFREKLVQLEDLSRALGYQVQQAANFAASGSISNISGTAHFQFIQDLAQQKQDVIRGFDGYERFLYFDSGAFSGSLSGDPTDPIVFFEDVSWPKLSGSVLSVSASDAVAFYDSQADFAGQYDDQNGEWLTNNIPQFIQADTDSSEFQTFLNMIGHHFDLIKLYVDNLTNIYDRDPSPSRGLSKELLWHVAQSLGIELPNQYSIKDLVDFAIGQASTTQQTYEEAIAETWKRFIHDQIFISKAKGTRAALHTLLNAYGIQPELIRIRESVTPFSLEESGSFEDFTELANVLNFSGGAHLEVPFSASGYTPSSIELRFATTYVASGALLQGSGSNLWSLILVPTGTHDKGKLQLIGSSSNLLAESRVGDFFSGDFFTVMLRRNSATSFDLTAKKFSQDVFEYSEGPTALDTGYFFNIWPSASELIVGSSSAPAVPAFSGSIDEFRVWLEVISNDTFDSHVKYPGMYAGNTSGSARDSLLWRHSMVKPRNLGVTSSLPNDSPFIDFHTGSVSLSASVARNFSSGSYPYNFSVLSREVRRFVLNSGGSQFATDTIRIGPSASFDSSSLFFVTGSDPIPVLHRDRSARNMVDKPKSRQTTTQVGFYFTLAETINDSILRSLGDVDLGDLIGDPRNLYRPSYPELDAVNKFYHDNYSQTVDYNTFIGFVEGLLEGIFAQAKKLVPARAKLLTGVVIEPTILERNRIVLNQPLQVDTSRTLAGDVEEFVRPLQGDSTQLNAEVIQPTADVVSADASQLQSEIAEVAHDVVAGTEAYEATIVQSDVMALVGADLSYETLIDLMEIQNVLSDITPLEGLIAATLDSGSLFATVPTYNAEIDIADLILVRTATELELDFLVPFAQPANDLTSPAGTTYFTHPSGSFGFQKFIKVRVREATLNDRGEWTSGIVYHTDDVVTQSGSYVVGGSPVVGNTKQWRCITDAVLAPNGSRVPFVSYLPPSVDRNDWVEVALIQDTMLEVRKAIESGSSVTIVPFATAGTPFIGYAPTHFRFFRDTSLRHNRPRFIGCLNTQDTTVDGKPPVEILPSSDAQLFVTDGTPIQPPTDEGGPLLTVR